MEVKRKKKRLKPTLLKLADKSPDTCSVVYIGCDSHLLKYEPLE